MKDVEELETGPLPGYSGGGDGVGPGTDEL